MVKFKDSGVKGVIFIYVFSPIRYIKIFIRNEKKIFRPRNFHRLRADNSTTCTKKNKIKKCFFISEIGESIQFSIFSIIWKRQPVSKS